MGPIMTVAMALGVWARKLRWVVAFDASVRIGADDYFL